MGTMSKELKKYWLLMEAPESTLRKFDRIRRRAGFTTRKAAFMHLFHTAVMKGQIPMSHKRYPES